MNSLKKGLITTLTLVVAAILIVGCGGSSSRNTSADNSTDPNDGSSYTALPYNEDFTPDFALASDTALATALTSVKQSDGITNMYRKTGGTVNITTDGTLQISGGRFTVGDKTAVTTTASSSAQGDFDLSAAYTISFKLISIVDEGEDKTFQIYVDNNTTSAANSRLGSKSIIYKKKVSELSSLAGQTIVIDSTDETLATNGSFLQIRTESGVTAEIDDLLIIRKI